MGIADDITYFALVVFTIVFGKVFKSYNGNQKLLGLFLGLLISLLVSGSHVYHVIVIILFNAFLITFLRRSCHIWSTTFTFTYLAFFRCSTYFGLEKSPSFTNAIVMMLTLKMVGVAFEVHDTDQRRRAIVKASEQTNKEEMTKLELESKYWDVNPTFLDVIFYGFCYIGILTGPYYKFRVWEDAIERKKYANIPTLKSAVHRVSIVPLFLILFLILSYFFPLSYVSKEEFFTERSVLFRIWYLFPLFSTFRMRLYSAFIMSEAACISAGLGAYPQQSQPKYGAGPTNLEIMENLDKEDAINEEKDLCFKTIQNVDAWLGEVTNTVRASMRVWNTTVQYWLAINVHRRFPIKPLRILVTMFVSAFWHGLYPGYYLALCSAAVAVFCEDVFIKKLKSRKILAMSKNRALSRRQRKEKSRQAALAALMLERRILAITTFFLVVALGTWIVSISTTYWITVKVDYSVVHDSLQNDNSSVKTRLLRSHSGLWRSCATFKRIENGSLADGVPESVGPVFVQTERIFSRCSSKDFDITAEDAEELKIDSTVARSLNDFRRTEISLAAISLFVMFLAVCFSIYTFRNPRYTFKRLAGAVNLITAATIIVLIEVIDAAITFEKLHLKQFYPNGSNWYFGFSYYISWVVFTVFIAAGILFLIYSRKKKGSEALNDEMAMADEAQIMGR